MAGIFDRVKAAVAAFRSSPVQEAGASGAKRDPTQVAIKAMGLAADFSRDVQGPPDFDLTTVSNAYDRESLVRQAVDRYVELLFKSGWDLVGKNQAAVDYVRIRLRYMAEITKIPTEQLLLEIAEDVVLYHNAVVLKARATDPSSLPPGVKAVGLGGQQPVAGYFPADVTTFKNVRDKNGVIKRWEQEVPGQDKPLKLKPEDVVFFYMKRRKGKAWGTPFLIPVLDDIRSLRQAEEHVLRLIYRNLFPFYQYRVGLNQAGFEGTDEEVRKVQAEIEAMDLEAGIVTTERHEIKAIASNQIIDAIPYLKHFWERVVMGLGVPETLLGKSNTSNKATADQLSVEMRDRIKAIQRVVATFIDQFMLDELLMEGGFDPLLPENDVTFTFREIDTDGLIKQQNHAVLLYQSNAITEDEMRTMLGRDPMTDRAQLFLNLVTVPTAEASSAAKAAAGNTAASNSATSKNKPTNQHGTKPSPKKSAKASLEHDDPLHDPALRDGARQLLWEGLGTNFDALTDEVTALIEKVYQDPSLRETAGKQLAAIVADHGRRLGACAIEHVENPETAALTEIALSRLLMQINEAAVTVMNEVSQSKTWAMESFQATAMVLSDRIDLLVEHIYPDAKADEVEEVT